MMTAQLQDTDRDAFEAEKAAEQDYFDAAKIAYDERLLRAASSEVSGNSFERASMSASLMNRKRLDETEAVATARMDLEDGETIYLGSVAIRDNASELLVTPWQSLVGNVFYEATQEDPLGVSRKRIFTTNFNRIESFNDVIFQDLSDALAADTFVGEQDPLLEILGRGRSEYMADIVRTITADQNRIIRAEKDQLLVIQGGPGTGKTAVALHRVSWLLYTYRDELKPSDVLVVGPNPTFTKYIKRVLPSLGDVDVIQQSLAQLLGGSFEPKSQESQEVSRKKGSAKMESILQKALENRVRIPVDGLEVRLIDARSISIARGEIEAALSALALGTYSRRRGLFKNSIQSLVAERVSGARRDPVSLIDPASLEAQVERVWAALSPQQFVRELYGSRDRLRNAGATQAEIGLLYRASTAKIGDEPWTMADLGVIDWASDAINGTSVRYSHIVVDEAQDLSYMQLRAVRRRSANGSMTVVGDIGQATSAYARKDWNQVITTLSEEENFTEAELTVGYRVPARVLAVAAKVLETAAPGLTVPEAFPRTMEDEPQWHVSSGDGLMRSVVSAVKEHSSRGLFVGVVVADSQMPAVRNAFGDAGLKWSESADGGLSQGINLVSPEESKGLEFDAVIVVEPKAILDMAQGAKLLYVALTRTVHHLDVVLRADRIPEMLSDFVLAEELADQAHEAEDPVTSEPASALEVAVPGPEIALHAPGKTLKPALERVAQSLADDFFEDLHEVGLNVQKRVLDLLWDKIEAAESDR